MGRTVRVPLPRTKAKDGFLKLSFLYSGAATQDRCIDVRYVGDSLTIRPETAIEIDIGVADRLDVATTAALMPRNVTIVLPNRRLTPADIATALTVGARAGRLRPACRDSITAIDGVPELGQRATSDAAGRVASSSSARCEEVASYHRGAVRNGRRSGSRVRHARRGAHRRRAGAARLRCFERSAPDACWRARRSPRPAACPPPRSARPRRRSCPTDRVTFDQLGVAPAASRCVRPRRPHGRDRHPRAARRHASRRASLLDVMVAPDGAGEKAVVSAFVNERLLGSTVAAIGEPTQLDLALPDGLVGTSANVRAVVQRRSAQGDCRFEPQGYPAQILGSSAVVLTAADPHAARFLRSRPALGRTASRCCCRRPPPSARTPTLGLVADTLDCAGARDRADHRQVQPARRRAVAGRAFIAVSDTPPAGATPRVRFDRGRVAVADRSGPARCSISAASPAGAVAQIVTAGGSARPVDQAARRRRRAAVTGRRSSSIAATSPFSTRPASRSRCRRERDTLVRDLLSGPGVVAHDRRALPLLDHRRRSGCSRPSRFLFALQRMLRRAPADASEYAMPLSPSDRALGDLLVGRHVITLPQLDEAVALAETWNVRLGDAVLSRNWIEPAALLRDLAHHFDLPFVDLVHEPPDPALLSRRRHRRLRAPPDDAVAAARRPPGHRDRRARPGDRAVRPPALGRGDRVRRRIEIRHHLGGADRIRRRAVAPRRLRARRTRSGDVGAARCSRRRRSSSAMAC